MFGFTFFIGVAPPYYDSLQQRMFAYFTRLPGFPGTHLLGGKVRRSGGALMNGLCDRNQVQSQQCTYINHRTTHTSR